MRKLRENTDSLSKGSKKILQNKGLVSSLASSIRDDVEINPSVFPKGAVNTFSRTSDLELASWFLSNLDAIEKAGYDGVKYSTDGTYNEWVVTKYTKGAHDWEDITGKLNQQMYNWYLLKKYKKLEPKHENLQSFNGVLDLGRYLTSYYANELKGLEDEAKKEQLKKLAKSIKLVDNDDYRIFVTLNRSANRLIGANTTWCTTNGQTHTYWDMYANQGFLYQLFPKDAEHVTLQRMDRTNTIEGNERYQFGPDRGYSFKDIADHDVSAETVRTRWPYLYEDLTTALRTNAGKYQEAIDELSADATMNKDVSLKVPPYKVSEEISKLKGFVSKGFFTEEKRSQESDKSSSETDGEAPQLQQPAPGQQTNEGNEVMENIDKDVKAMLDSLKRYDTLKESVAPVLMGKPLAEKKKPDADGDGVPDWADKKKGKDDHVEEKKEEVCEDADAEVLDWMKRFAKLGNMKGYGR